MSTPDAGKIGVDLLKYASNSVGEGKRGLIDQIYPFVHEASRTMGLREISRWLRERGLGVSHATISRALRKPELHWKGYFDTRVKPHAKALRCAWGIPMRDFLFVSSSEFNSLSLDKALSSYDESEINVPANILSEEWFMLPAKTREHCRPFANDD